jgi:predicted nucleic acid-binding protein
MIFVDTGFFFALFSLRDRHHQRAKEAFRRFEGQNLANVLVTTDQVVLETITLARMRVSHKLAVFMGERLYSGKIARTTARLSTSTVPRSTISGGIWTSPTALSTA